MGTHLTGRRLGTFAATAALALLVGCSSEPEKKGSPSADSGDTLLVFFSPADAKAEITIPQTTVKMPGKPDKQKGLDTNGDAAQLASADTTNGVAAYCGAPTPRRVGAFAVPVILIPVIEALAKAGFEAAWGAIDNKLTSALKAYTVTYAGTVRGGMDFYPYLTKGLANSELGDDNYGACFRLTHLDSAGTDGARKIQLDFIGRIILNTTHPQVLTITPVRLFVAHPEAPTVNGKVGIKISIGARANTIGRNGGASDAKALDGQLLAVEVPSVDDSQPVPTATDLINDPQHYFLYTSTALKYGYKTAPKVQPLVLQLPPWDDSADKSSRHNFLVPTVTISETGTASWLLRESVKLFSKSNEDKLADQIEKEAGKAIGAKP